MIDTTLPLEVKNNFIRGSLLYAIDIAAKQMLDQVT
jgi:hypothetical protein